MLNWLFPKKSKDIKLKHGGVPVTVFDGPYISDGRPTKEAVAYYTSLFEDLTNLRHYAAVALISLYNNAWLDDGLSPINEDEFAQKLTNPTIHLYDELGSALVYFNDGGLFAGHSIEVSVTNGVPNYAGIVG